MVETMACSFAVPRIVFIVILYSSSNWYTEAETEFLVKNSSLWGIKYKTVLRPGDNDSGIGWYNRVPNKGAFSCDKGVKNWFYVKKSKSDANRIFVTVNYKIKNKFCNRSNCGLFLYHYQGTSNFSIDEIRPDQFFPKVIGTSKTPMKTTTIYFDIPPGRKYITFAFVAIGVCTEVYNISVYYHYCPRDTSTPVILPWTPAPSSKAKKVTGYCSKSSGNSKGSMVAYCNNDGKWENFTPQPNLCRCSAGYEFNNSTGNCTACKVDFYKKPEEEGACKQCPKNSVTNGTGSTSCFCVKDHYRIKEDEECRQIPPQPVNFNYTLVKENQIRLYWDMAIGQRNVVYEVKCHQRDTEKRLVYCNGLSIPKQGVVTPHRNLTVFGLVSNTYYVFTVTSLNDISHKVAKSKWKSAQIDVQLPGDDNTNVPIPIITSPTPQSTPKKVESTAPTVLPSTTSLVSSGKPVSEKQEESGDAPMSLGPMIGGAIGGLFVVLLVAVIVYRRRRMKKENLMEVDVDMSTIETSYVDPAKYGNPEKAVKKFAKEIDRRQIKLEGVIGEGEFARVHKGQLCRPNEPPIDVAVKVLKPGSSAKNREDFLTEAAVMAQFKDMNIVALEGVVTISHPVMIITEFMHNGALSKFLAENKTRLGEIELLTMARGIASGMRYLARMRFVHRDLAARNVLVNENLVCKVADFGLTRELEESCQGEYVTQGGKIPIRWTAPEAYKHRRFTTASDVWSFGIVLWEIMSYAERPYGNWDNYMVMDRVNQSYRLTAPTNCPKIVHQLMKECWKADRNQRPAFADIVDMLERWIRNPYLLKDYEYVTEKTLMADRKSCVAKSIREHLEGIKMERYVDHFIDFGYTELYQIQHFEDSDLVGIGVPLVGHRNKIMKSLSLRSERERLLPTTV